MNFFKTIAEYQDIQIMNNMNINLNQNEEQFKNLKQAIFYFSNANVSDGVIINRLLREN